MRELEHSSTNSTRIILRRLMLFFVTRGIALAVIQVAHLATALAGIGGSWLGYAPFMPDKFEKYNNPPL